MQAVIFARAVFIVLIGLPLWAMGRAPVAPEPVADSPGHAISFKVLPDSGSVCLTLWASGETSAFVLHAEEIGPSGLTPKTPPMDWVNGMAESNAWDAVHDSAHRFVVVWSQHGQLYAQRFSKDGHAEWRAPLRVNPNSTTASDPQALATDAGVFVSWRECNSANEKPVIMQLLNLNGRRVWPDGGLRLSNRVSDQRNNILISGGPNQVIAAWKDYHQDASEIRTQQVDAQAHRLWGEEGMAVTAPAGVEALPIVATAAQGSAVFAWSTFPAGVHHTLIQRIEPDGRFSSPPNGVDIAPGNWGAWNAQAAGDPEVGFWIGWEDFRDESRWQLRLRHWSTTGTSLWTTDGILLADVSADQSHLSLAVGDQSSVWAAWLEDRSGQPGVYAQKVDSNGKTRKGLFGATLAARLHKPSSLGILSLPGGGAAVSFIDQTPDQASHLYVQIVEP